MCQREKNGQEDMPQLRKIEQMNDVNECIYWSQKKRDEKGKHYCSWDGMYYWLKECKGCENYRKND